MSDNFTAGAFVGFGLALFTYPVFVIIGAASVPFHRGSSSRSATAGLLFVARWTFYLTLLSLALAAWGLGMLWDTALVGAWTLTLTLLAVAYTYWRR